MPSIEVRGLVQRFGRHRAVDGISFEVHEGEIVGFLGPNGAGKTTTMRVITGFLAPTEGGVRVAGADVLLEPLEARRHVGYLPESAPVYRDLRVLDYLDYVARLRGLGRAERAAAVERVVRDCGLLERAHQSIGALSKGYRQRVGLAQALVHDPEILVLDEPTSGLDPNQIVEIRNLIRELGRRKTILLSTHVLPEVQALCDRVLIVHRGRLVADGTPEEIDARQRGGRVVHAVFAPGEVWLPPERLLGLLRALPGVRRVQRVEVPEPEALGVQLVAEGDARPALFRLAAREGLVLLELRRDTSSLEEVFQRLTLETPEPERAPAA